MKRKIFFIGILVLIGAGIYAVVHFHRSSNQSVSTKRVRCNTLGDATPQTCSFSLSLPGTDTYQIDFAHVSYESVNLGGDGSALVKLCVGDIQSPDAYCEEFTPHQGAEDGVEIPYTNTHDYRSISGVVTATDADVTLVAEGAGRRLDPTLAIRSIRNAQALANGNQDIDYKVSIGEDFKVAWVLHYLIGPASVSYQGPAGIGSGVIHIPAPAENIEIANFKSFKATQAGTGTFTLNTHGPGPGGFIPMTTTIHLTVTPN